MQSVTAHDTGYLKEKSKYAEVLLVSGHATAGQACTGRGDPDKYVKVGRS